MKTLDAKKHIQLNNILFATDFSPAASTTLPYAAELAKRFGANLFTVHVRTPVINPMTPPAGWPALERAAEKEARERAKSLQNAVPGIETKVLIEEGDIYGRLQAVIEKENIDLLVIGTRGRSGMGKLLLGSVAEEIFREVRRPVLTVGPNVVPQPNRDAGFTHIVCATSFGDESDVAASYAISLAEEFQAYITLLHVLEDPKAGDLVVPQDLRESSRRRLAKLVPAEAELWCVPDYEVERGHVAQKVLEVAENRKADLIVLGVHGPSGFPGAASHLPIATAHKVIANAHCPVLTVRQSIIS